MSDDFKREHYRVCTYEEPSKEPKRIIIDLESFRKLFGSYKYINDIPKEDLTRIYIIPARHHGETLAMEMFKQFCKNYFECEE